MGGDLAATQSPRFWVWAAQDPEAPLDRVQIVKGWVSDGEIQQRVWDVVCSNERVPGEDGKCPSTTAEVDLGSCERLAAGSSRVTGHVFRPGVFGRRVGVLLCAGFENPTCRWTTLLANECRQATGRFGCNGSAGLVLADLGRASIVAP